MRSFITCAVHPVLLHDQIKKDKIGAAYSTHVGDEKFILGVHLVRKPEERSRGLYGRICIKMDFK